ncbi:UNVERIFIED_CONTAM: hypothetical protein K2H54_058416 [Gekko kuhli]
MGDEVLGCLAMAAEVLAPTATAAVAALEEAQGQEEVVEDGPPGHPAAPVIPAQAQAAMEDVQAQVLGVEEEALGCPMPAAARTQGRSATAGATLAQAASAEEEALGCPVPANWFCPGEDPSAYRGWRKRGLTRFYDIMSGGCLHYFEDKL